MSDDQVFFKKNNAACEFRFDKGTAQHKRFKAFIELRDLTRELIEAMEGSKFQIKAMERTRKSLQKQLDKLEKANQDDTLTFEQLGIDRLFVDEAHEFKNLFVATNIRTIYGRFYFRFNALVQARALCLFLSGLSMSL